MRKLILISSILLLVSMACATKTATVKSEKYNWKSVQIVGGGFVDGIVFHQSEPNLRYARTDMGGAYRWDEELQRWIPLLDWVSYEDNNLMGVESIALDPNDANKLYLSCGTYTSDKTPNGEVLISNDRGNTFERIKMPFKMGGNENGRGNGERMAVDPRNGNILFLGTRNDGLWRSTDAGKTWLRVVSFPDVSETMPDSLTAQQKRVWGWSMKGSGVNVVVFDPRSGNENGCQTIYVAVSLVNKENIFKSTDAGKTWEALIGQPVQYRPTHMVLADNGYLFVTYGDNAGPGRMYNGAVWKYDTGSSIWTDITPDKPNTKTDKTFGYAAIAVDASNPDVLITSVFHRSWEFGGDDIFRSTNGGNTWKAVFANGTQFDYSKAPYVQHTPIHWMFDIEINPFNPNHAIFTTGFGGFETFNLTNVDKGLKTNWSVYSTGIEETVPLELHSPTEGAHLITGIGDYAGFVHWDLDKPEEGAYFKNPYFGNCDGITSAELNPKIVVRVGVASGHHPGKNIGYSEDFGRTWHPTEMPTEKSKHGHIAVSANGETWVWTPERSIPFVTSNMGKTWTEINTLKTGLRVVADRVNPLKFYAVDLVNGVLYTSTDGAKTFEGNELNLEKGKADLNTNRGDNRGGQDRIYATPGFENDLWIAAFDGLYNSKLNGKPFVLKPNVNEIHGFGFGKEAPGNKYPSLYLIGIVDGVRGVFRSTDKAQNWVRINDDQHQWGLLLHVTGDPKKYGRVYVGTHGRGALYADPENKTYK